MTPRIKPAPDEAKLIPTKSRAHLPRGVSYPLGAELVSDALRGVPQFDQLVLEFHAQPQYGPLDPEQLIFAGVSCRSRDDWSVWVSAVPSELAARARRFATYHGFAHWLAWLRRSRTETWFLHWHRCAIAIDPISNEGVLAEFEEQKLIERLPPLPLPGRDAPSSRRQS